MRYELQYTHAAVSRRSSLDTVVFDIETNGVPSRKGSEPDPDVWEIGAVRLKPGQAVSAGRRFEALLYIPGPLIARVAAMSAVNPGLPHRRGRPQATVLAEFAAFLSGAIIAGYNIRDFDGPILLSAYKRVKLPVPPELRAGAEALDVERMASSPIYGLGGYPRGLSALAAVLELKVPPGTHRALADALLTARILDVLCRIAPTPSPVIPSA